MAKFGCPVPDYDGTEENGNPLYYVKPPDRWLGKHTEAYADALDFLEGKKFPRPYIDLVFSLAIADDWRLPGMGMNRAEWDFSELPLDVIAWANYHLVASYNKCFIVKKNWLKPLPDTPVEK